MSQPDFQRRGAPLLGRRATKTGSWPAPCCSWSTVFHPLSFEIHTAPSCPPGISHILILLVLLLVCAGVGMNRAGPGPSAPASLSHQLHDMDKAPAAVTVGRAETSLPAAASSMLRVVRAMSCPAPSAKHTPQLMFPRWQINVFMFPSPVCGFPHGAVLGDVAVALCARWELPAGRD